VRRGRAHHLTATAAALLHVPQITGDELIQRPDDKPETVGARLATYHAQTAPVLGYYAQQGKLRTLNADQAIGTVWSEVKAIIDKDTRQPGAKLQ
jgi:adenylate kinase